MGYGGVMRGKATFLGFAPDGPGLGHWLVNLWRRLTYSPLKCAQYTWQREILATPPPAPLPTELTLHVGARIFLCTQTNVTELHTETP